MLSWLTMSTFRLCGGAGPRNGDIEALYSIQTMHSKLRPSAAFRRASCIFRLCSTECLQKKENGLMRKLRTLGWSSDRTCQGEVQTKSMAAMLSGCL